MTSVREELERRVRDDDDAEALWKLGGGLIISGGPPEEVMRGAKLVEQAAEKGWSAAQAMLALFAGTGIFVPQDWDRALDLVASAAEGGSTFAQGQLLTLARLDAPETAPQGYWRGLRDALDLTALMTPPPARRLSAQPSIEVADGFADRRECDWLVARADGRLQRARIYPDVTGEGSVSEVRTNSELALSFLDWDLVILILQARMGQLTPIRQFAVEPPTIMRYQVGERFEPHFDFLNPAAAQFSTDLAARGQRISTFLIYLNEGYEGGATEFPNIGLTHKGATGDAIFWSNVTPSGVPDRGTLHAGRAPSKGEKWLFSQWIRDRAQN